MVAEKISREKAIIDALRVLQDRTIGSPEACERAQRILVAGLSDRAADADVENTRLRAALDGIAQYDGADWDVEGVCGAAVDALAETERPHEHVAEREGDYAACMRCGEMPNAPIHHEAAA